MYPSGESYTSSVSFADSFPSRGSLGPQCLPLEGKVGFCPDGQKVG